MPFEKGHKKATGRPKGSENKLDKEAKELFIETLGKHSGNIDAAFAEVFKEDKTKFLELFSKYAQFFTAKKTENSDTVKHEFKDFDIKEALGFVKTK